MLDVKRQQALSGRNRDKSPKRAKQDAKIADEDNENGKAQANKALAQISAENRQTVLTLDR